MQLDNIYFIDVSGGKAFAGRKAFTGIYKGRRKDRGEEFMVFIDWFNPKWAWVVRPHEVTKSRDATTSFRLR